MRGNVCSFIDTGLRSNKLGSSTRSPVSGLTSVGKFVGPKSSGGRGVDVGVGEGIVVGEAVTVGGAGVGLGLFVAVGNALLLEFVGVAVLIRDGAGPAGLQALSTSAASTIHNIILFIDVLHSSCIQRLNFIILRPITFAKFSLRF